ncbi:MAG: hypothetical protein M0006_15865 [Magnetospirillum sp.]|nr:hypothetical protein [Magnetospirillum sp.]
MSLPKPVITTVTFLAFTIPAWAVDVAVPQLPALAPTTSHPSESAMSPPHIKPPAALAPAPHAANVPATPEPPAIPPAAAPYQDLDTFLGRISPKMREEFRDYQLETWRIHLMADRAAALRSLCAGGYGPPDRCPSSKAAPTQTPAPETQSMTVKPSRGLPTPIEINGGHADLHATVRYQDGQLVDVQPRHGRYPGTILPTGEEVVSLSPHDITYRTPAGAFITVPYPIGQ